MPNENKSHSITDGFHLVVDALKLNGIDTVFGVRSEERRVGKECLE